MRRLLSCISLIAMGVVSAPGATITSFRTYTNFGTIPTSLLAPTFSKSTANVGNATVSCFSATGCNGTAFVFTLGASGYDPTQVLSAFLGGNLSGTTPVSGRVYLTGNFAASSPFAFSIPTGNFESNIFSATEPITGLFSDISFFSLTLALGQVLTLTDGLTLSFSAPAATAPQVSGVPEPSFGGLLAVAFTGFFLWRRRFVGESPCMKRAAKAVSYPAGD